MYSYFDLTNSGMEEVVAMTTEEMVVPTPAQLCKRSLSGIIYHLRYTYCDTSDLYHQKQLLRNMIRVMFPYFDNNLYVGSIEHFKAGMNIAKPHFHLVFCSTFDKETLRSFIVGKLSGYEGIKVTGNKKYSLKPMLMPDIKAWRYVLKQQKNDTYRYSTVSPEFKEYCLSTFDKEVPQLRDEAYAIWITACEVVQSKEQHEVQKKELQDRMFAYLEKSGATSDLDIKVNIGKFYVEEERKPFNKTTALGYFYNYKITKGLMTYEELALIW